MRVFQSSVRCGASKGLFGPREKPSHTVTEGDHASEMTSRETDQILACQRKHRAGASGHPRASRKDQIRWRTGGELAL